MIVAALIILATGWEYADPVVSVAIGLLILASSWTILRDSVQILLEGSPPGIDVEQVGRAMAAMPRRQRRSTTCTCGRSPRASRRSPRTCSSTATPTATPPGASSSRCSHERFGLDHTTLQVDHEGGELLQIETAPDGRRSRRVNLTPRRLRLSDDRERLDVDATWEYLRTAYWSPNVPREVVERAIAGSLCLGLYAPDGAQVGFARAVTDRATYAWIADVFVLERRTAVAGSGSGWSSRCSPIPTSRGCAGRARDPRRPRALRALRLRQSSGERTMVRSVPPAELYGSPAEKLTE